jgi:hypothetical protein
MLHSLQEECRPPRLPTREMSARSREHGATVL